MGGNIIVAPLSSGEQELPHLLEVQKSPIVLEEVIIIISDNSIQITAESRFLIIKRGALPFIFKASL